MVTADGSKTAVFGYIPKVSISIMGRKVTGGLLILANRHEGTGLLGLDAVEKLDLLLDCKNKLLIPRNPPSRHAVDVNNVDTNFKTCMNNNDLNL